jgi:hypothetical protein
VQASPLPQQQNQQQHILKIPNKTLFDHKQQQKDSDDDDDDEQQQNVIVFPIIVNGCLCEVDAINKEDQQQNININKNNNTARIIPDQVFGPFILLKDLQTNCILLPNGIDGSVRVWRERQYVTVRFEGANLMESGYTASSQQNNNNEDSASSSCFIQDEMLLPMMAAEEQPQNQNRRQRKGSANNNFNPSVIVPRKTVQAAYEDAQNFAEKLAQIDQAERAAINIAASAAPKILSKRRANIKADQVTNNLLKFMNRAE